jgi:hypothetical protein
VTHSPEQEVDLQNLWLALEKKKTWRVLAVVPATKQIASLDIASAIAEVAWQYRGEPTVVLDLREITMRLVDYHRKEIEEHVKNGENVIVALASIQQNPTTIALAKNADTSVLVVRLGETSMKSAVKTVDEIGHEKFAGTILARPKAPAPASARAPASSKSKATQPLIVPASAAPAVAVVQNPGVGGRTVKLPASSGGKR